MDLLERRFLNGRDRLESCIRLTAQWIDGWKFKDGKWKFEQEAKLLHLDEGYFRCRVHLYSQVGTDITTEVIREVAPAINSSFALEGVQAAFSGCVLTITVPLDQHWGETANVSMNPMIFRHFESLDLALGGNGRLDLQVLITYRNLNELLNSKRMFIQNRDGRGYRWVGSHRSAP